MKITEIMELLSRHIAIQQNSLAFARSRADAPEMLKLEAEIAESSHSLALLETLRDR